MPCLLQIIQQDGRAADETLRYRAGDILDVLPTDADLGGGMAPERGGFYYIQVIDRTVEQLADRGEEWTHQPEVSVVSQNYPDVRLRIESARVSNSRKGRLTRADANAVLKGLRDRLSAANPVYVDHGLDGRTAWVELDITVPDNTDRERARAHLKRAMQRIKMGRRRYRISAAGMLQLETRGGFVTASAAQIANFIEDKLNTD